MRIAHVVGLALLLVLGTPWRSTADPIQIQSGSLQAVGNAAPLLISLIGDRGFTFDSGLSRQDGVFAPDGWRAAGAEVSLHAAWMGSGFLGALAMLDGQAIGDEISRDEGGRRIGGMDFRDPQASFRFDGSAGVLPLEGDAYTLTAPFTFAGTLIHLLDDTVPANQIVYLREEILGHGMATLVFASFILGDHFVWNFRSADYHFSPVLSAPGMPPAAAPVPEPWSVLLLGSGLVGLATRIRGRNKRTTSAHP